MRSWHFMALLILLSPTFSLAAPTDSTLACYWVAFTDKEDSPYSIEAPEEFLSPRSIERRRRFGIPLTQVDLPVNPAYLDSLKQQEVSVRYTSRWLNGAAVVASKEQVAGLRQLPFTDSITYISKYQPPSTAREYSYEEGENYPQFPESTYGFLTPSIQLLNGDSLHALGYRGEEMYIGVLDGGFINVDKVPVFDSLRQRQSLADGYDFADADRSVLESSTHGTSVLSAMAAYSPGTLVGTAPMARYVCMKTEEVRGEYRLEEYNWVAGIEYADSLGVDVINASLGYYHFSDPEMNYRPEQLDGTHSPASRAADIAFERGMIVVVSAGNEGSSRWKYIDVPADAPYALSIAAVRDDGQRAGFSSIGREDSDMIKPDLAAPGVNIPVPNAYRTRLSAASGTSLAAPLFTGLITCLWQAFPNRTNAEIVEAVKASASQSEQPDKLLGYGIPDFMEAYRLLQRSAAAPKTE